MRILHLITTLDVGGAEMHVLAQLRGQAARGHEARVAFLKGFGTLAAECRKAGARSVRGPGLGPPALRGILADMRWAEIVHTHLLKADMLGACLATLAGRRAGLVASKHNDEQVLKRPLVSFIHGLLGNLPRRTIVLSDHVGRFIHTFGRVREDAITRIYYGLDPAPFCAPSVRARRSALRESLGLKPEEVVFLCVARFAPQKDHGTLLHAFARARAQAGERRALRLLLVGDDPFGAHRSSAEALCAELGLQEQVVFTGIRRDVPELLAASDVFAMSSLWEGLGLVFLEAMAAGLPILATRVSAVPEVVADGESGLLVPPGDVEALAQGMLALASDPALRARMGKAGETRVREHFGLEPMIDHTIDLYEELCGPEKTT